MVKRIFPEYQNRGIQYYKFQSMIRVYGIRRLQGHRSQLHLPSQKAPHHILIQPM